MKETETLMNKKDGCSQRLAYKAVGELSGRVTTHNKRHARNREYNVLTRHGNIKNRQRENFETILNRPFLLDEDIPHSQ